MNLKPKLILKLILGIFILAMIFWIPESSLVVGIVLILRFVYKKIKSISVVKIRKK